MSVSERPVEQKILIAVDFGTTFSGIAWAQTGESEEQNIIQHWPDQHSTDPEGKSIDKVPTTLRYDSRRYRWGYQIESLEERYEWFKLDLDPSMQRDGSGLARRYPALTQVQSVLRGFEKSPKELSIDYLTKLREHAEYMVSQTLTAVAFRRTLREYIITVPAVWSDRARDLTASCAIEAGMGTRNNLHIISEPEAAAMYAFKAMPTRGLAERDTFVLCDAGGGTVDLISYTILSLRPTLELEEAAPGSGSACGSTFLNRIFAKFMNNKFRGDFDWEEDREIFARAMEHFETETKSSFNGTRSLVIPVHGVGSHPGVVKNRLTLSIDDLKGIFEPVISEVVRLIAGQIRQTAKAVKLILLVGGFGSSFYLRERIKEAYPGIEVKVAPNCQTAVVRGALLKGLAEVKGATNRLPHVRIDSRKARKYYGTEILTTYTEGEHNPRRKQRNHFTGGWSVPILKWFLKKGEAVRESVPSKFPFAQDQPVSEGKPKQILIKVYCYQDPMNTGPPKYKTEDVLELATVKADIGDVELDKRRGDDGHDYYVVDFDIEMACFAAKTEFTPVYRGKRYKAAKIEYV